MFSDNQSGSQARVYTSHFGDFIRAESQLNFNFFASGIPGFHPSPKINSCNNLSTHEKIASSKRATSYQLIAMILSKLKEDLKQREKALPS